MAHIGINAHLLAGQAGYRQAGIHHYIKQLLNHLPHHTNRYTIFTGKEAHQHLTGPLNFSQTPFNTENPMVRIAWEQAAWPLSAVRQRVDLLHSMAFVTPVLPLVSKRVVTVYDLSFYQHPERFTKFKRLYLQSQTGRSVQAATRVATISESGKHDVHTLLNVPLDRIDVVPPGVAPSFTVLPADQVAAFREREGLNKPFVLHVGTLQPRKNIPTLIQAFAQLQRDDIELVLVGGKGWLYDDIFKQVKTLGLTDQVRFTGYVPDGDLPLWYNAAALFAFPSVYEGFGMPVAQAMACGTPVIGSNTSSVPEVIEQAGLLFDPTDVDGLATCIRRILDDEGFSAELRTKGLEQARKFTWKQAGEKMADCYQRALSQQS